MSFCSAIKMSAEEDCLNDSNTSFRFEIDNTMGYLLETSERLSDDILDLLPADPFGMDFIYTFTQVFDMEMDSLGFICHDIEMEAGDGRELEEEVNEISMEFHVGLGIGLSDDDPVEEVAMYYGYEKYRDDEPNYECQGSSINCAGKNYFEDCPPDVLFTILGYLGVRDLLNIQSLSKFFRNTVRNSSRLWKCIHIDQPMNTRLTDDNLLWLTSRAKGNLQCLRLVQCTSITVGGLRLVLESNPRLIKLSIPGCVRLDLESILCCLKSFKSLGFPGIKQLSVGNVQIVTQDQFDELNLLLDIDHRKQVASYKPRFYGAGNLYLSCTDDRRIDIEKCPGCQKFRQVYDCPAESCQGSSAQLCKACLFCITRCINCGQCISDSSYEETFCLDLLCLDCLKKFLKCQEEMGVSSNCTIIHEDGNYHFYVYS